MSLLTRGPDKVLVFPEIQRLDERRNLVRIPSPNPVTVYGRMQPLSTRSHPAEGQETSILFRFIARSFPGGPWALVNWDGRDWDVVGEPAVHNSSPATRRTNVLLRAREPRTVPSG